MNSNSIFQNKLDVEGLGQVFTPDSVVNFMLSLRENQGLCLEPSAGDGAFIKLLDDPWMGIELDPRFSIQGVRNMDFFDFEPGDLNIRSIVGNPPYVKFADITEPTKSKLDLTMFDKRTNLYLFFIKRCIEILTTGGELIFIVPREFTKVTSAAKLNTWIHSVGNITHFVEMGDAKIFDGATPNVAIFRFVKGEISRETKYLNLGNRDLGILDEPETIKWEQRIFTVASGQIVFSGENYESRFSNYFFVKVGAVSGADAIFVNEEYGETDFVFSGTASTGKTRKMIFNNHIPYLDQFKELLISRRIKAFDESNWWTWGRGLYVSNEQRIYVNQRTRNSKPFFIHECKNYDGSVLAVFPKVRFRKMELVASILNEIDWHRLGFVIDGRLVFTQRSLENAPIPMATSRALKKLIE